MTLVRIDKASRAVTRFSHDPDDPRSFGSGAVLALLHDHLGRLWAGTAGGGLQRFDPTSGGFEHFRHDDSDARSLASDLVTALFEDRAGRLWVGHAGAGLDLLDASGDGFRHFAAGRDGLPNGFIPVLGNRRRGPLLEDRAGALWVATGAGLARIDPERQRVESFVADPADPYALGSGQVSALLEDQEGTIWVGTQGGGLARYDPAIGGFHVARNDPRDPRSLGGDFVTDIFEERSGILWIGTNNAGVSSFSRHKHKFEHYSSRAGDPQSLGDDMTFALLEDRSGSLWVGTQRGGLERLDATRSRVVERYGLAPGTPRDLGSSWVRAVLEDRAGRLWAGSLGGGLALIDRAHQRVARRFVQVPDDPSSLSNNQVFSIFEDRSGELWVGTANGWNHFDPARGTFTNYFNDPQDPTSLVNNFARFTYEDRAGRLWVGTVQGLARFDRASRTFTHYRHDFNSPEGLAHDNIMDLYDDGQGGLWIATYGGGLDRLDLESGRFTHFTTRDGLPNDSLYSVVPDDDGYLWLSSNNGLTRFDPRRGECRNFDSSDGLQSNEFNGRAFFRAPSGELLFGGVGGFNAFHPGDIPPNRFLPPVVLTAFRRFGRPVQLDPAIDERDELVLSYKDDFISFEFSALDYTNPGKNQYAYRLEGFDPDWVPSGTRRYASYTNLDPGRYVFRVKASNSDGLWNEQGKSLRVIIQPPPWKSGWAYALYGLILVGGVFGYARRKSVLHREEIERERVEAEIRRKTEELEQARRIQLSMVPETPPDTPGLEIAAYMNTATEVGGDYYDFFPQPDGSLYAVTGDATGHGISAGMMVAMTKSALKALDVVSPRHLLERLNGVIRAVNPERMKMALNVAHVGADRIVLASAGMPPAYVFRAATRRVEEVLVPGLPLGSIGDTDYHALTVPFHPGDVLLMLSDGLPELVDEAGHPLGYDAIPRCLAEHATASATGIREALVEVGRRWAGRRIQDDDITLVVIRRRDETLLES